MSGIDVSALIERPGSRWLLPTPALVLDLDRFESNLAIMANHCRTRGLALRPHAKSHRSANVARRQIEGGAIGLCCAKLGEAEALADQGIDGLLITSPVVTASAIARLVVLNRRIGDLAAVVDDPTVVTRMGVEAQRSQKRLRLLVDVDVGLRRTGVSDARAAVALATAIDAHPWLEFAGIQGYAGHLMHVVGTAERRAQLETAMAALATVERALRMAGLPPRVVTGGGTGSIGIDGDMGVLTEVQPGSYPFMDSQYEDVWTEAGEIAPFRAALFVQSTVISAGHAGLATLDAGYKAFATDADVPRIVEGAPPGSSYFFFGDEQGGLTLPDPVGRLSLGTIVTCSVPHCDPTINLYDVFHVVRGDMLIDIWAIEARGRSA